MPHHKSATKRLKTAAKERDRNAAVKSTLRKQIRNFRAAGEGAPTVDALYSTIDRAARKGVIPKARADRLKSRLSKRTAAA